MKWASAISQDGDLVAALEECVGSVSAELGPDAPPSLAVVFASANYGAEDQEVPRILGERFPGALILGCSGAGVIGAAQEVEQQRAVALTVGHLPGVNTAPLPRRQRRASLARRAARRVVPAPRRHAG